MVKLKLKLGEAAHIRAARKGARYAPNMTDPERADIDNGIWLCANCHTMVDKNDGADFPVDKLIKWKEQHEQLIYSLLISHRSPLPILRRFTKEGEFAQAAVDSMQTHGALFVDMNYEYEPHVIISIDRLRDDIKNQAAKVKYDQSLKRLLQDLHKHLREFMNETSKYPQNALTLLPALRIRVGVVLGRLRDEFGCNIPSNLHQIIP